MSEPKRDRCPACDDSDRVPTLAGDLCRACRVACRVAIERRRLNGGQWAPGDLDYAKRAARPETRGLMLRRLTIAVIESAHALDIIDGMEAGRRAGKR